MTRRLPPLTVSLPSTRLFLMKAPDASFVHKHASMDTNVRGPRPLPALRPASLGNLDVDGQDLAAAGRDHLGFGHAPPFGGDDEQRGPCRAAEGAGETAAIQVDGLQHGAARSDTHAP